MKHQHRHSQADVASTVTHQAMKRAGRMETYNRSVDAAVVADANVEMAPRGKRAATTAPPMSAEAALRLRREEALSALVRQRKVRAPSSASAASSSLSSSSSSSILYDATACHVAGARTPLATWHMTQPLATWQVHALHTGATSAEERMQMRRTTATAVLTVHAGRRGVNLC